jgi:hypothetical protein
MEVFLWLAFAAAVYYGGYLLVAGLGAFIDRNKERDRKIADEKRRNASQ